MPLRDRTQQADFFWPPSPLRHFERSRPTFSSAFALAKASACAERNPSSPLSESASLFTSPPASSSPPPPPSWKFGHPTPPDSFPPALFPIPKIPATAPS